mgnify:CR=1 FL=1
MSNISIIGAGGHSRSSIPLLRNHFPDAKYEIFDNSFGMDKNIIPGGLI